MARVSTKILGLYYVCHGDCFSPFEAHSYNRYDMTTQPDTVQKTREERFRWDEENRLTALSQNGYVSHYWYDADGERTVKMHGGSMAVFISLFYSQH